MSFAFLPFIVHADQMPRTNHAFFMIENCCNPHTHSLHSSMHVCHHDVEFNNERMEFLSTDPMGYNIHRPKTQIVSRRRNGRTEAHQRNHLRSVHIPIDTGTWHSSFGSTHSFRMRTHYNSLRKKSPPNETLKQASSNDELHPPQKSFQQTTICTVQGQTAV